FTRRPWCVFSDVTCDSPPEIAGGKVQGVKKSKYMPGERVQYPCWQGFQMTGDSTVACENGTWMKRPKCTVPCTASEEDMNRNNIELRWTTRNKLYAASGDVIEFECKTGYEWDPASSPLRAQCVEGTLDYPHCKLGSKSSAS
ncbi:FHR5 protein, partial [Crypturellus soui]|nr:FHR5 protein [Crypturellus soui]